VLLIADDQRALTFEKCFDFGDVPYSLIALAGIVAVSCRGTLMRALS
jgi:hypothetical protein